MNGASYWAHPTALVESDDIGAGTRIWAFAHVMNGVHIGSRCNVGDHVFLESGVRIGNGVTIKNSVLLWNGVEVGDYVFLGPNAVFTNDRFPRSPRLPLVAERYARSENWLVPTHVAEGASVGAHATILCGLTLGAYCCVAAGSVVTKDVRPFTWVAGNPARPKGYVNRHGHILKETDDGVWRDPQTGWRYRWANGSLEEIQA